MRLAETMAARGTLRIYLGAAPGVGKTTRCSTRVGGAARAARTWPSAFVETHGREHTAASDRAS